MATSLKASSTTNTIFLSQETPMIRRGDRSGKQVIGWWGPRGDDYNDDGGNGGQDKDNRGE